MSPAASGRFGDLGPRVAAGLGLALVAAIALGFGGSVAAVFVLALILAMFWELHRMATGDDRLLAPGLAALAAGGLAAVVLASRDGLAFAFLALLGGGWLAALLAPTGAARWLASGALYIGGALCLLLSLRFAGGALAVLWLVLVVIAADVGAYFVGRAVGGPRLWPAVSPGKTWSGALGGLAAAALTGVAFALAAGWGLVWTFAASVLLAMASQAGDLLESAVKRHFGVKDASSLLPGHGGVMDRLDGVAGAAWAWGLLTLLTGGVPHGV